MKKLKTAKKSNDWIAGMPAKKFRKINAEMVAELYPEPYKEFDYLVFNSSLIDVVVAAELLYDEGQNEASIDLIYEAFDVAMWQPRWEDIDEVMQLSPKFLNLDTCIALLTITLPGRNENQLSYRESFFNRVVHKIDDIQDVGVDLLVGLGYN